MSTARLFNKNYADRNVTDSYVDKLVQKFANTRFKQNLYYCMTANILLYTFNLKGC